MSNIDQAAEDLFFKLRNRFPKINMGNDSGSDTVDPEKARFFNFEYVDKESQRPYGRITCSLIDGSSLKVFFDTAITDRMIPADKNYWYRFLRELRRMAKSHMLNFDVRDITKDTLSRQDLQYMTKLNPEKKKMKESLEESRVLWQRRGKFSEGTLNNVRINVVHNEKMLENTNNRLLKVDRIYLVNENGEKFLLPFKSVGGAKAMANHVSRGGNPYDPHGQIISRAVSEMKNLSRFTSVTRTRTFEAAEATAVITAAQQMKESIKRHLNRLTNNSRSFSESLEALSDLISENTEDLSEVKGWFTQQTYNENLDNYLASAAGAYRKLKENATIDEAAGAVEKKIMDPNFKLVLKKDAGLDKLMSSRKYTDTTALLTTILGDVANRLITQDGDDVANFAALMGDLISSEGEAFGQKREPEYIKDKKLAIVLAQKYMKDLNAIRDNPEYEAEVRQEPTSRKTMKGPVSDEGDDFEESIMRIGEEDHGASVEDITDAISHRLMHSGAANKLLRSHGLDAVIDAISNIAHQHAGAPELGSSDISIMVNQVMQDLGVHDNFNGMYDEGIEEGIGKAAWELGKGAVKVPAKAVGRLAGGVGTGIANAAGKVVTGALKGAGDIAKGTAKGAFTALKGAGKDIAATAKNVKQAYKEDAVSEGPMSAEPDYEVTVNGKPVDIHSLEVENPYPEDYPDFVDAYFSAGQFTDGTPMSDQELEQLGSENGDLLHTAAHDNFNGMYDEGIEEGIGKAAWELGKGAVKVPAKAVGRLAGGVGTGIANAAGKVVTGALKGAGDIAKGTAKGAFTALKGAGKDIAATAKNVKQAYKEDELSEEPNEGNEFSGNLAKAKAAGKKEFEVDGKTYPVKEEKKEKTKETPMKKDIEEMRKLAGLPLMENYIYAQEEESEEHEAGESHDEEHAEHEGNAPSSDDKAEYDQEGRMAKSDLKTAKDAADELRSILDDDENLPEWVQAKITKAVDYLDTARDYMKDNDVEYTAEAATKKKPDADGDGVPDWADKKPGKDDNADKDDDDKSEKKGMSAAQEKYFGKKNESVRESRTTPADLKWLQAVAGIINK